MKKVNVLAAVLAMVAVPTMAFGAYSMSVTSTQGQVDDPAWTGSFIIAVGVQADEPISGAQYNLMVSGPQAGLDGMYIVKNANGTLFGADTASGYHSDAGGNFVDQFAASDIQGSPLTYPYAVPSLRKTAGEAGSLNPETILFSPTELDSDFGFSNVGEASGSVDGSLLLYQVNVPAAIGEGTWVFSVGDGGQGFGVVPAGATEFAPTDVAPFTFTITPEPASILMLLAAVPFIRRRR